MLLIPVPRSKFMLVVSSGLSALGGRAAGPHPASTHPNDLRARVSEGRAANGDAITTPSPPTPSPPPRVGCDHEFLREPSLHVTIKPRAYKQQLDEVFTHAERKYFQHDVQELTNTGIMQKIAATKRYISKNTITNHGFNKPSEYLKHI